MFRSKFSIAAYMVMVGSLFTIAAGSYLVISEVTTNDSWLKKLFSIVPILWILFVMTRGELIRKCIYISIDNLSISISSLGFRTGYDMVSFDGYKICQIFTSGNTYEEIYLMSGAKRIVTISSFYIKNYIQAKNIIQHEILFIGTEHYSFKKDILHVFK